MSPETIDVRMIGGPLDGKILSVLAHVRHLSVCDPGTGVEVATYSIARHCGEWIGLVDETKTQTQKGTQS